MPRASTALAVDVMGSRVSIVTVAASLRPTCSFQSSLASTRPQSRSRLMMKASVVPLLNEAVMVQSRNLPLPSKLASPSQPPEVKAFAGEPTAMANRSPRPSARTYLTSMLRSSNLPPFKHSSRGPPRA